MLRRQLPSTNSLFVFEAVARCGSFSAAAIELNVTQPAVSNAIARLESHLGVLLFYRKSGVSLTWTGERLFSTVSESWAKIETCLAEVRDKRDEKERVIISLSSSQMANWLLPKIPKFSEVFPDVNLQFQFTGNDPSGPIGNADLAVRYGEALSGDVHKWMFAEEKIFAVCSSSYLSQFGMIDSKHQDHTHNLITITHPRKSWSDLFEENLIARPSSYKLIEFPEYSVVLQAAINGQGVALGWLTSVVNLLSYGILVQACQTPVVTGRNYHIIADKGRPLHQTILSVKDWLISEMSSDIAECDRESLQGE